jgi:mRNA interferase HicA
VKRGDLERHLRGHGGEFLREGGKHSIWWNPGNRKRRAFRVIAKSTTSRPKKICRDLKIPVV